MITNGSWRFPNAQPATRVAKSMNAELGTSTTASRR
jgi:hypothetical protein